MGKKYKLPEENPKTDELAEPAVAYERNVSFQQSLPTYTIGEIRARADRAIQEVEEGKVFSQEEMRKRHPR